MKYDCRNVVTDTKTKTQYNNKIWTPVLQAMQYRHSSLSSVLHQLHIRKLYKYTCTELIVIFHDVNCVRTTKTAFQVE